MADEARGRNADEGAGARARNAGEEVFQAHARVDDNGDGAEAEECERGGDEREALAHQDERAIAALNAATVRSRPASKRTRGAHPSARSGPEASE